MVLQIKAAALSQNINTQPHKLQTINYSKYIGRTVEYFFSNFSSPILVTIPIRNYTGINRFILKIGNNEYLYIIPKIIKDSTFLKRKPEDEFNLKAFYNYEIIGISYKKEWENN